MSKPKKSIKKTLSYLLLTLCVILAAVNCLRSPSDMQIKSKVVKLTSARGSCSGEQIKAPSGVNYILTAAHCRVLEVNGQIHAITEDGRELDRRVLVEDPNADLLLLEGVPGMQGLEIASSSSRADIVRTFTHGKGQPTYRTEGVIIYDTIVDVGISDIMSPEDEAKCIAMPKYISEGGQCVMHVLGTVTTAKVVPGSSGGPMVNEDGELVGVVSAGSADFSIMVPLQDIRTFVHSY